MPALILRADRKESMIARAVGRLNDYTFIPLRLTLGIVFLMQGYGMLGQNTLTGYANSAVPFAYLVCGMSILLGFFTRIAAFLMSIMTLYWLVTKHLTAGFFVSHGGYEYHLVLFVSAFTLIHLESGKASLEHYFGFR